MPAAEPQKAKRSGRLAAIVDDNLKEVLDRPRTGDDGRAAATVELAAVREAGKRSANTRELPLGAIEPDPDQVRHVNTESEGFRELVASIREHGVLEPINVRWIDDRQVFQIVTGERRYRAARAAKLETITAVIRDVTDAAKPILQLVENIQRQDLNPMEEARAFKRYLDTTHENQDQLARKLGKDRSYVTKVVGLVEQLTEQEQSDLLRCAPAHIPGRSLIFEAARLEDTALRRAILRGELTRAQVRQKVAKAAPDGRRKQTSRHIALAELKARVTVTLEKPDASEDEILEVLVAAQKEQQKRAGKRG